MANTFQAAQIAMDRTIAALSCDPSCDPTESPDYVTYEDRFDPPTRTIAERLADPNDPLEAGDLCQCCNSAIATHFLEAGEAEAGTGYAEDDLSCCDACYRELRAPTLEQLRELAVLEEYPDDSPFDLLDNADVPDGDGMEAPF